MPTLKPITATPIADFRSVRLRALADSPLAFGSTHAKESQFTEADWNRRVLQWNSEQSTAFLAWDDSDSCGIVACFLDVDHPTQAHLVSMWVAPTHRKLGVGRLLVNHMIDWARSRNAMTLHLMVTSCNDNAMRFYERLGFARTGKTEPYPNDPALVEYEMVRSIASN
jgi:ribosomal protein S18 acetylase RimI-like enzyme